MKLVHVIPAITEEASGPSYTVPRLCDTLTSHGNDVTLAALDWAPLRNPHNRLLTFPLGIGPRRLGSSPAMRRWLNYVVKTGKVDVIHNHGMWQMNSLYPSWASKRGDVKLVYSPRGALSKWAMAHGSSFKRVFWPLAQRPALEKASCFHATSIAEYEDIRRLGFKQPVAVIPNGIDLPTPMVKIRQAERTLLFLGRIHPVKGIDILLDAWARVHSNFPDWWLAIAGSDIGYNGRSGHSSELKERVRQQSIPRVKFLGALYGNEKSEAYSRAELYVLPSHSENFAVTVAEALAVGTPAIVSKGAPWGGLETNSAGWWVDIGVDPLANCLIKALSCAPQQLAEMGSRGREWMERDYSWDQVGLKMNATYEWLSHAYRDPPKWVHLN